MLNLNIINEHCNYAYMNFSRTLAQLGLLLNLLDLLLFCLIYFPVYFYILLPFVTRNKDYIIALYNSCVDGGTQFLE